MIVDMKSFETISATQEEKVTTQVFGEESSLPFGEEDPIVGAIHNNLASASNAEGPFGGF